MPSVTDTHKDKRAEMILQQLEDLPALPEVPASWLEAAVTDTAASASAVARLAANPVATARILSLLPPRESENDKSPKTLEQALFSHGAATVRLAAMAAAVVDTLATPGDHGGRFDRRQYWMHCVGVACCAEILAEQLAIAWGEDCGVDPTEAFVCGLLHDIGKIALDTILPKSFERVVEAADLLRGNIADVERTVIGIDHMTLGKRLAEHWQLPGFVRDVAWLHGQLPEALPATVKSPRLVNLVTLADGIVRSSHLGYSGNYAPPIAIPLLLEAIGLTSEHVDAAGVRLVSRVEARVSGLGLTGASSGEIYRDALTQANREIGRVGGQLETKAHRLTLRTRFLETLSGFQSGLRADAPSAAVLHAVAQTAQSVIGPGVVVGFSLPPGQAYAEVIVCDTSDHAHTLLVDCPDARPLRQPSGVGPVLPAGDELAWLVEAVSPRLHGDHYYWISLEADGACIGGVLWGGPGGEGQRLSNQLQELLALAAGWSLALRTSQIREESRVLSEQLADANRRLQNAQAEILRSRTLTSVGEMAAGAAHEMNNPLAVISGRSQLLASQLPEGRQKNSAKQIHDQSQRLSDIITELMHFAKPVPPATRDADLSELVGEAIAEAKSTDEIVDRTVEVTCGEVPRVRVDPQQVRMAVAQVLVNAIQATDPASGKITVAAAFDPYSNRVVMTVSDNGCGMDDHTLKRAFDPFFSSRPAGRRRGMGLAKALRWLESSGGSIRLESRVGQGTRAIMLIPAASPDPSPASVRRLA